MKLNYGLIVAVLLSLILWACIICIAMTFGVYGVVLTSLIVALLLLLVLTIRG